MEPSTPAGDAPDRRRMLAIYLRDHYAGSTAGLALVRRCRQSNRGNIWDRGLAPIETEIEEDRLTLESVMGSLGVEPSPVKSSLAAIGERFARLKSNGRLIGYSPLSRLIELETLAAAIATKRKLWRTLRHVSELNTSQLDQLIERATGQLDRMSYLHDQAAQATFENQSAAMSEAV